MNEQADLIAKRLRTDGASVAPDKEIVALIAYLQSLGKSEKIPPQPGATARLGD